MDKLEIICDGDSWTFGCEIVNPELVKKYGGVNIHRGVYDYYVENDKYRIPKIWSTFLEEELNATCYNISWPADDNGTILNRTIDYVTTNYILPKKDTSNLIVIVGWSSPERNSFWYKDDKVDYKFRLAPNVAHFDSKGQEDIWNLYVQYLWNKEEYIPRFIMNVLQLQTFCNANNIKWVCYNSFYQVSNTNVQDWVDLNVKNELSGMTTVGYEQTTSDCIRTHIDMNYSNIWETINVNNFYKKDEDYNTFRTFIMNNCKTPFEGWHPSEEGHRAWAKELSQYITNNIL
jgi:hypothetical protein